MDERDTRDIEENIISSIIQFMNGFKSSPIFTWPYFRISVMLQINASYDLLMHLNLMLCFKLNTTFCP
jgi:hypothetical protein